MLWWWDGVPRHGSKNSLHNDPWCCRVTHDSVYQCDTCDVWLGMWLVWQYVVTPGCLRRDHGAMVGTTGLWWGCHNNTHLLTGMRNSSDPFSPFLTAQGILSCAPLSLMFFLWQVLMSLWGTSSQWFSISPPMLQREPLSNNVECSYSLFFHFKWNINARALSTIFRNKSFRSILVHNYPFDVLFSVLLFQVKKQEIYREVNWPRPVAGGGGGAAASWALINHGQRRHLWTPTDFRHHQGDIWNDENGLGIEFVTIVVAIHCYGLLQLEIQKSSKYSTFSTRLAQSSNAKKYFAFILFPNFLLPNRLSQVRNKKPE